MALQRNTVIWLAIAVALGGYTYIATQRAQLPVPAEVTTKTSLFSFTEARIATIEITFPDQERLVFQQEATTVMRQWRMLTPQKQLANHGAVSFLTNLLTQYNGAKPFPVTMAQLPDYGLDETTVQITINLVDGSHRVLTLGKLNFDKTKIYGRIDQELEIWALPLDFWNAVNREPHEWLRFGATTEVSS
ncbi:MAG: DUF4340 domain-containing protein [Limnothrix sp. RL_2_0]|nr:DUF4340 domain-containing protein [Limnothrix sp. RL_2_0]